MTEKEIHITGLHVLIVLIIVFTCVTRFYHLDTKPYHHDESLYAYESWKLFEGYSYRYNPMLHGPFLFYMNAVIYGFFGDSNYTARISSASFVKSADKIDGAINFMAISP